jgi:uncharacterized protein (TIGR00661 family)
MATIFYGIAGEGRGHATRSRAVIEALRGEHRIVLYTYGQALSMLGPMYRDTEVDVRAISGLMWQYTSDGKPSYSKTFAFAMPYLATMPLSIHRLREDIQRDSPDLIISDFEPIVARAARHESVPFVSLDHQHFLVTYDLSDLPWRLQLHAHLMGTAVGLYHSGAREIIVSSFFRPPLLPDQSHVTQVGPLLRPEVISASAYTGSHLCAYIRRDASPALLESLSRSGLEVRLYGLGARPSAGRLRFFDIDPNRFIDDLASSRGLVCTAGNQLIGEALYLEKPVFAMPESGNFEQEINAHYIAQSGVGMIADMTTVSAFDISRFIDNLDEFKGNIIPSHKNGNPATLARLARHLPSAPAAPQRFERAA